MAREKRKWEVEDREAEVYTGGGGKTALAVPPSLKNFKPPKSGTFRIDVIAFVCGPAVKKFAPDLRFTDPGKMHWNVVYWLHFGIGPNNAAVVCPQKTFGKACPICKEAAKYGSKPHPDDAQAARELRAKERQLLLVSLFNERTGENGPIELWDIATFNFKENLKLFQTSADTPDEERAYRRFWVPEENLRLKLLGQEKPNGSGGTYSQYTVLEMKAPREPLPDDIWDHGYDLFSFPREMSFETISQMFHGVDEGGAAPDADPEDVPARAAPRKAVSAPDDRPAPRKPAPRPGEDSDPEPPRKAAPKNAPVQGEYYAGDSVLYRDGTTMILGSVVDSDPDRQTCRVQLKGRQAPVTFDWEEPDLFHATDPAAAKKVERSDEDDEPRRPTTTVRPTARPQRADEEAQDPPPRRTQPKVKPAPDLPPEGDGDDDPKPRSRPAGKPSKWDDAD